MNLANEKVRRKICERRVPFADKKVYANKRFGDEG
jgi:hypothetical protein